MTGFIQAKSLCSMFVLNDLGAHLPTDSGFACYIEWVLMIDSSLWDSSIRARLMTFFTVVTFC